MKNKLTANISLKIVSLLFAFLIWLVVNNINDPIIERYYMNIPVKLLNTELITDSGQVYEVLDDTTVIDRVTVWAPRSVFSSLSAGNIVATADVNELSSLDTIRINLTTNLNVNDIEKIEGSIDTVKLHIENLRTKSLALKATVSGSVEEGYLLGEITPDQNLVRVSGPESIISQVSKAVADVPVTGFTSDIADNAEIKLYDSEDNLIQDSRITQNIKSVGVKVSLYRTMEVPIYFSTTGTPAAGYKVLGEIEGSIDRVMIAGKENALKNINSIEVSGEKLDISGLREDFVTEISLRDYLPENVFLADSSQNKVEVTAHIQSQITRNLVVSGDSVDVVNVPEGYRATIEELEENIDIGVQGFAADVSGIRGAELKGRVDILKWMADEDMAEPIEGYYQVEVDFGLPDDVEVIRPLTVMMHLSKVED
ncbi:MAG: hypothetical protein HDR23_04635 [Lachnospiraceae bacterium]|nr:hypothetical protein [Lachnospiraceae bacterium]